MDFAALAKIFTAQLLLLGREALVYTEAREGSCAVERVKMLLAWLSVNSLDRSCTFFMLWFLLHYLRA